MMLSDTDNNMIAADMQMQCEKGYHLSVCECEDVVADFLPVFTPHTHEVVLTKSPSQFFS